MEIEMVFGDSIVPTVSQEWASDGGDTADHLRSSEVNILKLLSIRSIAITLIIWKPIGLVSKGRPGPDLCLSGLILASNTMVALSEISRAIESGYSPGKHNVSHFL